MYCILETKFKKQQQQQHCEIEWPASKRQMQVRMGRKGNPCALLVRIWTGAATMENGIDVPQKIKNITTIWSSNCTSGNLSEGKKLLSWKSIYIPTFIAALFTTGKAWKQLKCL